MNRSRNILSMVEASGFQSSSIDELPEKLGRVIPSTKVEEVNVKRGDNSVYYEIILKDVNTQIVARALEVVNFNEGAINMGLSSGPEFILTIRIDR